MKNMVEALVDEVRSETRHNISMREAFKRSRKVKKEASRNFTEARPKCKKRTIKENHSCGCLL
jgi:hypothetical protein